MYNILKPNISSTTMTAMLGGGGEVAAKNQVQDGAAMFDCVKEPP